MKSILFKIINIILFTTSAYASEIYVSQVGSDLTLEIQQHSEDNYVNIYSTGNDNTIIARQGMHEDGTIDVDETGGHEVYWTVTGDGNNVASYQTDTNRGGGGGDVHHIANIVNGDNNIVKHTQMGKAGHTGYIEVQGDNNNVDLYQRGNGGQQYADIVLNGDGHTVEANQRGTMAHSLELNLTNNGGAYSVTSNQTTNNTTTSKTYSLTGSCADANGCSVSVSQN